MTSAKKLAVYLNKAFAGTFEQNPKGGTLSFNYDFEYLKFEDAQALSTSLPLQLEPFSDLATRNFFSGLLPDNHQLTLVAEQLKSSEKNPFALLSEIGRDCAGAIEILPFSETLPTYKEGRINQLTEEELYKILNDIRTNPLLAGTRKIRLSLAGAQSKLAVFFDEETNSVPALVQGKPSTHILKPTMPDLLDSVHNEFFCMKLAKKIGLKVPEVFLKYAKEKPYLLIRRYDRIISQDLIMRIHQEDFCQALGLPPEFKYQGPDGGPGIKKCINLIEQVSSNPALDKLSFINAIIFNYLIGNSDAHGKNFSLLYQHNGIGLAPLYDLVCTAIYKNLNQRMAMKIGRTYEAEQVSLVYWHHIVPRMQTSRSWLDRNLRNYALELPQQAIMLKDELEKQKIISPVFDDIINVIYKRANLILKYFH